MAAPQVTAGNAAAAHTYSARLREQAPPAPRPHPYHPHHEALVRPAQPSCARQPGFVGL